MDKWSKPADPVTVEKTIEALQANGINAEVVKDAQEAKKRVFEIIPQGAEVMNMTSRTLDSISISSEITESGKYNSVRNQLNKMDRKTQNLQMQKLSAAPDYAIGSVHAVTEDGQVVIASNSGSQLPAYISGSPHVIWVVGTQKIVKDLDEAMERIDQHSLPLERQRAKKAYGIISEVSKIAIIKKEKTPNRITLIFVPEVLGF